MAASLFICLSRLISVCSVPPRPPTSLAASARDSVSFRIVANILRSHGGAGGWSEGWRFSDTAFAFVKCFKVLFFFLLLVQSATSLPLDPFPWMTHIQGNRQDFRTPPYDGETFLCICQCLSEAELPFSNTHKTDISVNISVIIPRNRLSKLPHFYLEKNLRID